MIPINLQFWIEEHRHLLKPPVGNQTIYKDNKDFIVMIVGGPNARKDYHINIGEEIFYQLEGTIQVGTLVDGLPQVLTLQQGDMLLVPGSTPHMPMRPANTIGLVIERHRAPEEQDQFLWICERCHQELHRATLSVADIVTDLPKVMETFWSDLNLRTCKNCGHVMDKLSY